MEVVMRRVLAVLLTVLFLTSASASGQSPCAAPSPAIAFGDGTWIVGADIEPGTYRAQPTDGACYWFRLSGFSGDTADTIAAGVSTSGPALVTVKPTDAGLRTIGCSDWAQVA